MKLTKEYLETLSPEGKKEEILREYIRCKSDPIYCIENYFTVKSRSKRIPFKLYAHQINAFESFEKYSRCITLKSRQQGLTVCTAAYIGWWLITKNNQI